MVYEEQTQTGPVYSGTGDHRMLASLPAFRGQTSRKQSYFLFLAKLRSGLHKLVLHVPNGTTLLHRLEPLMVCLTRAFHLHRFLDCKAVEDIKRQRNQHCLCH